MEPLALLFDRLYDESSKLWKGTLYKNPRSEDSDDIFEPDENTLAGRMEAMSVKKICSRVSDDESSTIYKMVIKLTVILQCNLLSFFKNPCSVQCTIRLFFAMLYCVVSTYHRTINIDRNAQRESIQSNQALSRQADSEASA